MGVHPQKERAVDALSLAIVGDGLADGEDVVFVEAAFCRCAPVTGCAEAHLLGHIRRVRVAGVIGRDETGDIHQ